MNHKHVWSYSSSHHTSQGAVRYLSCTCGAYGIDLDEARLAMTKPRLGVELRA